jgi:uncharacterized damage-inducible protein DinB
MIHPDYARRLARYNRWRNDALYAAADRLDDAERRAERGAFFKSIHGTLNHLLWADAMWLHRLAAGEKPDCGIDESGAYLADWETMTSARVATDERLSQWAETLTEDWLRRDFAFVSSQGFKSEQPGWVVAVHVFNHQTHHRGQAHALLTAAGVDPGVTDFIRLP